MVVLRNGVVVGVLGSNPTEYHVIYDIDPDDLLSRGDYEALQEIVDRHPNIATEK